MDLPVETWVTLSTGLLRRKTRRRAQQTSPVRPTEAPTGNNQTLLKLTETTLEAYQKQTTGDLDNRQQPIQRPGAGFCTQAQGTGRRQG